MTTKPGSLIFVQLAMMAWCLIPAAWAHSQDTSLKWKFVAGDQYQVQLNQSSNSLSQVDSRLTAVESRTAIRLDWKVLDVDDQGTARLEQSLAAVQVSVGDPEVPSQAVAYDTDGEPATDKTSRQLRQQVQPLIGLKVILTIARDGKVVSVIIPEATEQAILGLPEAMKLKKLFQSAGVEELLGGSTIVLPDDAAPGSEWNDAVEIETPMGSMKRSRQFSVNQPVDRGGREQAEIRITSAVTPAGAAVETEGKLETRLISFSGTGSVWFDIGNGYCTEARLNHMIVSERPYREKTIKTTVDDRLEMSVTKK